MPQNRPKREGNPKGVPSLEYEDMGKRDPNTVKDKELQVVLNRIGKKIKAEAASPSETTKQLKALVAEYPEEKVQHYLGFVPTPMARTSPIFPMSDREKAHRPQEVISVKTPWGRVEVSGPRLSIFEEDVLLAILAILKATRRPEETETPEGQRTYTIKTSMPAICEYLRIERGKLSYKYIEDAIKRLVGTVVSLEVNEPVTGKKRGRPKLSMSGTILSGWSWDKVAGKIFITLNPYFYETFKEGLLTYLDLTLRRRLKGDIAKALLRFYESHRANPVMHMITIGDAINLRGLEPKRLKARMKKALAELKKVGYLREIQIDKSGIVKVEKGKQPITKSRGT